MAVYKVVTNQQAVEYVEADTVEIDPATNRVTFYKDGNPVASFTGYNSFSVVDPVLEAQVESETEGS